MAGACPRGGTHEEGVPQTEGDQSVVRCTKCGAYLSGATIPKPGEPGHEG
jgi:uncharacterized Zn finger protein